MSGGDYLVGVAFLGLTVAPLIAASWLVLIRRLGHLVGVPRLLAGALLLTSGILAVHIVPLALGMLTRGTPVLVAWLMLAASTRTAKSDRPPSVHQKARTRLRHADGRVNISWAVAGIAVWGVAAFVLAQLFQQRSVPVSSVDALSFHLPNIARWIQTGSLWQIDQFAPNLANGNYPNNGDVLHLAAVLPFHGDALYRLVDYPFYVMTGLAVYAIARELKAPATTSALMGSLTLAIPAIARPALVSSLTDDVFQAAVLIGVLFGLRHARSGRRSDLVLAGLGLGIAFGTKWYGVSEVPALIAIWAAAQWLSRRRNARRLLSDLATVVITVALAGGIWLLRNLVESANPVFPVKVAAFGLTLFDAPRDLVRERFGYTVFHYLPQLGVMRHVVLPAWRTQFAATGLVAALGVAVIGVGHAWRWRHAGPEPAQRHDRRPVLLALAAVVVAVIYAVTPYTALGPSGHPVGVGFNARYGALVLLLGAPLAAVALGSIRRPTRHVFEAMVLLALLNGLRLSFDLSRVRVLVAAMTLLAVAAAFGSLARSGWPRWSSWRSRAAVAASGLVAVLVLGGYAQQRTFYQGRYEGVDATFDWVFTNAPAHHRIGLSGSWGPQQLAPILPMFGPRLENYVAYAGPFVDHMLRAPTDRHELLTQLQRRKFDLLLIGRGVDARAHVPQERWARAAGFRQVTHSARFTLMGRIP